MSCDVMSRDVMSRDVMSRDVMSCDVMLVARIGIFTGKKVVVIFWSLTS